MVDFSLLTTNTAPILESLNHLLEYHPSASCTIWAGDIVKMGIPVLTPYGVFHTIVSVSYRIIRLDGGSCIDHDKVYHVFVFDDDYTATTI